ncbi:carboxypeptidase-like regulatory domain-containing protein [Solitalea koreensis]|uniref:CarboxypepD_reg-like domain-containing protein n=1 Tax=Solitalea koreensis TaxID=543615 RepID=A0A521DHU4_9SPHI|nr:carboxypeptidase-like regulatory domain-containing protein [Solitalea koreensis]SMO71155.1 hypothetical protein SAMN06265350_1075 [Solitalea koreensis]
MMKLKFKIGLVLILIGSGFSASAQSVLSGKVIDKVRAQVLENILVTNASQNSQSTTDKAGMYKIWVMPGDTILFSGLGFQSQKIIIEQTLSFLTKNIYMIPRDYFLPEVIVSTRKTWKQDSLQQRQDYARVYNYKDPSVGNLAGMAVFHPLSFIEYLYSGKKRKNTRSFQKNLINYEHEKYIDNYYNAELVSKIAKISDEQELNDFMKFSRPQYLFLKSSTQYDLYAYVSSSYKRFKAQKITADTTQKMNN